MRKGILEFDLPDEDAAFQVAQDGYLWQGAYRDLLTEIRTERKYVKSAKLRAGVDWAWDKAHEIMNSYGLTLD